MIQAFSEEWRVCTLLSKCLVTMPHTHQRPFFIAALGSHTVQTKQLAPSPYSLHPLTQSTKTLLSFYYVLVTQWWQRPNPQHWGAQGLWASHWTVFHHVTRCWKDCLVYRLCFSVSKDANKGSEFRTLALALLGVLPFVASIPYVGQKDEGSWDAITLYQLKWNFWWHLLWFQKRQRSLFLGLEGEWQERFFCLSFQSFLGTTWPVVCSYFLKRWWQGRPECILPPPSILFLLEPSGILGNSRERMTHYTKNSL